LIQISDIFIETANQEKEHAERFFKYLEGGELEITSSFPAGVIGNTFDNLMAAAEGEEYEWSVMYPEFAKIAKEEGFDEISHTFESIIIAEKQHDRRYKALAKNIKEGRVFKRNGVVTWRCRNCGYLHEAKEAPELCPACNHPQSYFELLGENW
jgi:rubrerythrin